MAGELSDADGDVKPVAVTAVGDVGTDGLQEAPRVAGDAGLGDVDGGVTVTAAVNAATWSKLPVADRDTQFAFRAATDRLAAHASSIEQFSSWFFWRDESKPANNRNSYRMPFADVFDDGTVKLVPAAVFSAAAQLSGAHGALPIIPEPQKEQIRAAIDRIYAKFRDMWDDPRQVPPWQRPDTPSAADEPVKASVGEEEAMPIELVDDEEPVTAAGIAPARPPLAWFADPQLKGPTRVRVTDDGRVYGHVAAWKSCHMGYGDQCLQPPRSKTGYAHFATGTTMTAEGVLLKTGNLVSGGDHAPHSFTAAEAAQFYASTSAGKAAVAVGEDAHGIWVAGALSAGVGEEGAQDLRQHPLSGDWRNIRGTGLEMIAALAVNVPGFPIPEYTLTAAGDEPLSLISAGVVDEEAFAAAAEETARIMERVADLELRGNELKARAARRRQGRILNIQLPVRGA